MKHFLLFYDLADTYMEKRGQYRTEHLNLLWDAAARGEVLVGGAILDPVDTALILFTDKTAAENFVKADPYYANGLIKSYRIREWTTVVGEWAASPVKP